MVVSFSKYHGAGNDFILIDDRNAAFPAADRQQIERLCHRQYGIGADGLLLLQNSSAADFRMRVFNSDGREVEMCGNGARCLLHFIHHQGLKDTSCRLETMEKVICGTVNRDEVSLSIGKPQVMQWGVELLVENHPFITYVLDTGVPHAVFFVSDVEKIELEKWGRRIRNHAYFAPLGVNVNFAAVDERGEVRMRTYERGVEGETKACGTGAAAVAVAAMGVHKLPNPIQIWPTSGEKLEVIVGDALELIGPAKLVFQGTYNY